MAPRHVERAIHGAGLRPSVVFEDLNHHRRVVGQYDASLRHAQEARLAFGLAEGAGRIDCDIGIQTARHRGHGRKRRADLFVQVVDRGGFTAAGRTLRIPKSTLSHRIQELESNLGVRLLNRTSRRFGLTDAGEDFYRHAAAMLREAELAEATTRQRLTEPTGTVRCTAAVATMQFALSDIIADFLLRYPKVDVARDGICGGCEQVHPIGCIRAASRSLRSQQQSPARCRRCKHCDPQPDENALISRRTVLGAAAAGLLVPFVALSATRPSLGEPELFVFNGHEPDRVVVALLLGSTPTDATRVQDSEQSVRIHVGNRAYLTTVPAPWQGGTVTAASESRIFSGTVVGRGSGDARPELAVILETPVPRDITAATLGIWAEVLGPARRRDRRRVASPFVAAVLREHPPLAHAFHRGFPTGDTQLRESFAQQVQSMAAAHVYDSYTHGKRLAAALLPDVIPYRPDRPVGLSFAAHNGRHPNDQVEPVVAAVLSGAVSPRALRSPYPLAVDFPYFVTL